jgi:hypothetical protein
MPARPSGRTTGRGLRVEKKVEVALEILPIEAGQGLPALDQRPQQQALALPLVDTQRARGAVVLDEKTAYRVGVTGGIDLQAGWIGPVFPGASVKFGRNLEHIEGAQGNQAG